MKILLLSPLLLLSATSAVLADLSSWETMSPDFGHRVRDKLYYSNLLDVAKQASSNSQSHDTTTFNSRVLQPSDRACNAEIGRVSIGELRQLVTIIFGAFGLDATPMLASIVYDMSVMKICGTCDDLDIDPVPDYCQPNKYGASDATHSSLAFLPLQPGTIQDPGAPQILPGKLRSVQSFHGATVTVEEVPTEIWPTSLGQRMGAVNFTDAGDVGALISETYVLAPAAMAAGVGAVGMAPDYLGYGASLPTHNRTFGYVAGYQQEGMVAWQATKMQLTAMSEGCTRLGNEVTILGTSEGGCAASATAAAMRQAGVRVLKLFASAPFFNLDNQNAFVVSSFDTGLVDPSKNNILFVAFTPLIVFAYSAESPGFPNTGTGQPSLNVPTWANASDFSRNVLRWMESPDPLSTLEVFQVAPPYTPEILNPALLELIQASNAANQTLPCGQSDVPVGVLDKVCEAIEEASVWDLISQDFDFPMEICYSPMDTIVPATQYPDELFANSFVTVASPPFLIEPLFDHGQTCLLCSLNMYSFLGGEMYPNVTDDQPNVIVPLEGDELEQCLASQATSTPSSTPSMPTTSAPSLAPQPAPVDETEAPTPASGAATGSFLFGSYEMIGFATAVLAFVVM